MPRVAIGVTVLPDHEEMRQHAGAAIAKHNWRGRRLDKARRTDNIDEIVALCMALDRTETQPEPVRVVAWR